MRVLVLGSTGQIGHELLHASWPAGVDVVGLARPAIDMADPRSIQEAVRRHAPAVVVNATAYTAVDQAESEREAAFAVNRDGPGCLAEMCGGQGVPLIHISTDYVFDGTKPTPYTEDDPVCPLSVYGLSKEAGEAAVRAGTAEHVIVRTAWIYGTHGRNFAKTMLRLGAERDELRVVADQHGTPTAADDVAAALMMIALRAADRPAGIWGTYHFTDAGSTTWHGFAERIFRNQERIAGRRPRLVAIPTAEYPTPARRPANSRLDCARIERVFGVVRPPWEDSADRIVGALLRS